MKTQYLAPALALSFMNSAYADTVCANTDTCTPSNLTLTGTLNLNGSISGTSSLAAPATGGGVITLPAGSDTLTGNTLTQTLFNKTLAGPTSLTGSISLPDTTAWTSSAITPGTALTGLFASPPAIGGTTPGAISASTLTVTSTVSGTGITSLFASPPAIGGGTPAAGHFTSFSSTGVANNSSYMIETGSTTPTLTTGTLAISGTAPSPSFGTSVVEGYVGLASSHGLVLQGEGSSGDVTLESRSGAAALQVDPNSSNVTFFGNIGENGSKLCAVGGVTASSGYSVTFHNTTCAFQVTAGTTPPGSLTITFASPATNGWRCTASDETSNSLYYFDQSGHTSTTASFTAYSRTSGSVVAAVAGGDIVSGGCVGY